MELKEKDIQKTILDYLNYQRNIRARKINTVGIFKSKTDHYIPSSNVGMADIIGIIAPEGKYFAFEVKTPKRHNTATEAQKRFLDEIQVFGGISGVVSSIEDVENLLKDYL